MDQNRNRSIQTAGAPALGDRLRLNTRVNTVTPTCVTLATGETVHARLVIDARGEYPAGGAQGWQTFLGQDLELDQDHGVRWPLLLTAGAWLRGLIPAPCTLMHCSAAGAA